MMFVLHRKYTCRHSMPVTGRAFWIELNGQLHAPADISLWGEEGLIHEEQ
jgi:hypothetical protein